MISKFKTEFFDRSYLLYHYYNRILIVRSDKKALPHDQFTVLLLGGSVLHPNNGAIGKQLENELSKYFDSGGFWVHNAAIPGHSSRDSYLKTLMLKEDTFDLVIFYHGINETRANNCSQDVFSLNYDHMGWYREVHNAFHHDSLVRSSCLPYLFDYSKILMFPAPIPQNSVLEEDLVYGGDIKTQKSFEMNLRSVADYCAATNAELMVPSFAFHIDPGYSLKKFEQGQLDYNPNAEVVFPIELWGTPENVRLGIEAHNGVIRDLASEPLQGPELMIFDLDSAFEKNAYHFDDICHLSDSGSARFVELLMPQILEVASGHPKFKQDN